jgi:hypothetical protein
VSRNNDEVLISHLLFANYLSFIFCEANPNHLHCLFLCFEVVSDLKVNLSKLELVPIGTVEEVGRLAGILGCRVSSLPVKYFGLLLGDLYKAKSIWKSIIEKMERNLVGWKRLYLSKGVLRTSVTGDE